MEEEERLETVGGAKERMQRTSQAAVFIFTNDSVSCLMNNGADGLRLVKYSH